MARARHEMPPEIAALSLDEIAERYIGRFRDKKGDWEAFEDANLDGYRRAQHRFIGAGGSGKHDDPTVIPARAFTLSVMYVPPGQGNAPHTHEVEEVFFVLQGYLTVFVEDEGGAAGQPDARAVGMHRLPAGCHSRLSEREPRAGLLSGHAGARPPRDDGLCR
jgi:mannose-6-phosphate isomerase-like protein (cupin superfamily)